MLLPDAGRWDSCHQPVTDGPHEAIGGSLASKVLTYPEQGRARLCIQAIYGRATGQLKNMGFMAFMMWMSGSQIQIFSIMMTANGIYQPLAAIASSGQSKRAAGSMQPPLMRTAGRLVPQATSHISATGAEYEECVAQCSQQSIPRAASWML